MVELPEKDTLIIPVGPSGAGKTKFFKDYINDERHKGKYVVVSFDDVRTQTEKQFKKEKREVTELDLMGAFCDEVRKALSGDKSVIADAQNLRYDQRKKLKDVSEECHKGVCALVFDLKKGELEERNKQSEHPMSQAELDDAFIRFSNESAKVRNEFTHVYTVNKDGHLKDEELGI